MKTITIASIAGNKINEHAEAILKTASKIPHPCQMLLFSPQRPTIDMPWVFIPDWGTDRQLFFEEIGLFTLYKLPNYIHTDVCIIVQADGYGVNKTAWSDEFLDWDYIGAPWPLWETLSLKGNPLRRVGSGGFNLRTKKFLNTSLTSPKPAIGVGEDISTPRIQYKHFESCGCRFAPVPVALKWCMEHKLEDYPRWKPENSFGQHGFYHGVPMAEVSPLKAFYFACRKSLKQGRLKRFNPLKKI